MLAEVLAVVLTDVPSAVTALILEPLARVDKSLNPTSCLLVLVRNQQSLINLGTNNAVLSATFLLIGIAEVNGVISTEWKIS